jgi:hypothetical protein
MAGFALDAEFGYCKTDTEPAFAITNGEKYFVAWDGVTYETTAVAADSFAPGAVLIGNGTLLGLPGNDEPFAIGYVNGMVMYVAFTDPSESHIIGIQQNAVKEIALQDKTITENGEYTADEGFDGLGKVLVEIASGGGGSIVCKTGSFKATANIETVQHDLGVTPSVFYIWPAWGSDMGNYEMTFAIGIGDDLAKKSGITSDLQYCAYTYSNSPRQSTPDSSIETDQDGPLRLANASTIQVGASVCKLIANSKYTWFAIGIIE